MNYWILDDKTPRAVTLEEYIDWERAKPKGRFLAQTETQHGRVSTVFLMINHNFDDDGPPLVFETLVFLADDEDGERYATYGEAMAGHARYVEKYGGDVE